MVQALAFAEIFGGLILAYAGYKGRTPQEVVKGEVKGTEPALGLGSSSSSSSASAEAPATTAPAAEPPAVIQFPKLAAAKSALEKYLKRSVTVAEVISEVDAGPNARYPKAISQVTKNNPPSAFTGLTGAPEVGAEP